MFYPVFKTFQIPIISMYIYLQPESKTVYIKISWILRRLCHEFCMETGLLIKAEKIERDDGNIPFVQKQIF